MALSYFASVQAPAAHTPSFNEVSRNANIPTGTKVFFALMHVDVATTSGITAPSYVRLNGVNMTLIAQHVNSASGQGAFLYKYENPPEGASNTLTAMHTTNAFFMTGVSVIATGSVTIGFGTSVATTATTFSCTISSTAAGDSVFFIASNNSGNTSVSGNSGTVNLVIATPDNNGASTIWRKPSSASSTTGNWTQTASNRTSIIPITLLESSSSVRALVLTNGELGLITDAQVGTGKKPVVLLSGDLKERAASEGLSLTLSDGVIRQLATDETLII